MRQPKEADRFEHAVAAWQKRVPWPEEILLPLAEHLFIVKKGERAIVKTTCGQELCAWNEPWPMHCRIIVRNTREKLLEIYPEEHLTINPDLIELREFICPGCGTLLDVDCVPPTYPIVQEFTPDLEGLYAWLGKPLPVKL